METISSVIGSETPPVESVLVEQPVKRRPGRPRKIVAAATEGEGAGSSPPASLSSVEKLPPAAKPPEKVSEKPAVMVPFEMIRTAAKIRRRSG